MKPEDLVIPVVKRTREVLMQEADINSNENAEIILQQKLKLREYTAIISVGGMVNALFAFSFDASLLKVAMEAMIGEVEEEEYDELLESTAGEIINIVIGNVTDAYPKNGSSLITISPPAIISSSKTISRYKDAEIISSELHTDHGDVNIICVTPQKLFDLELNPVED